MAKDTLQPLHGGLLRQHAETGPGRSCGRTRNPAHNWIPHPAFQCIPPSV